MGKLFNLATVAAAVGGAAYYLNKKGILKVTNNVDEETGSREFGIKYEAPEKPLADTVKEDLKTAADTLTEKANELVGQAKAKVDEVMEETGLDDALEELGEKVEEEGKEVEKDIDELLKDLENNDLDL